MADIVSPEQRSRMMAGIRDKNTRPELMLRRGLHAVGFRYRLHGSDLPGTPDIVFPRYGAVIMVHGCFWHGHDCSLFRLPESRREFWEAKIGGNRERDQRNHSALLERGWRVCTVWECSMRGKGGWSLPDLVEKCEKWLRSDVREMDVKGEER